jgi:hypothetical protein
LTKIRPLEAGLIIADRQGRTDITKLTGAFCDLLESASNKNENINFDLKMFTLTISEGIRNGKIEGKTPD